MYTRPLTGRLTAGVLLTSVFLLPTTTWASGLYNKAAWAADIPPGAHDAQGVATIIDKRTIHVEHFTYDGTAPAVYFYLGATNTYNAFLNGLRLQPELDREYDDESITLFLPDNETLDDYGAISVWCAEFDVNFSSASFEEPSDTYERAGWVANMAPGAHMSEGMATIINERIIFVENFTYDGTAPAVYFYLGQTNSNDDFENGLGLLPRLDRAYNDESLVRALPDGETLDGWGAISVWCQQANANFTSASFEAPCLADANCDGGVDIEDVFAILAAWGACDNCPEDITDDGLVDIDDVFEVLAAWGPCP